MTDTRDIREKIEKILGEPATGSRGQGGLPVTGSVIDYTMYFTKDGKKYLVDQLLALIDSSLEAERKRIEDDLLKKTITLSLGDIKRGPMFTDVIKVSEVHTILQGEKK